MAFGRSIVELGLWWWASPARIRRLVRLEGGERLAAYKGKPVILLVPHFVGIDAGWIRMALEQGLVAIYTRQKNRVFEAAMNGGRLRFGNCELASRQEGTRKALKAMKGGRFFHYSPDMDYGPKESIFVPFFGVPTATITALSRLAKLTGATVIPVLTRMEEGIYVTRVGEPWTPFPVTTKRRRAAAECLHRSRSAALARAVLLAAQALQDAPTGRATPLLSGFQIWSCRIRSDAFSAIITTGELVLPDTSVGMIEQSTTRSPARPRTRSRASTTAIASSPILQVPDGWKIVAP
jgi:hypothetical protein